MVRWGIANSYLKVVIVIRWIRLIFSTYPQTSKNIPVISIYMFIFLLFGCTFLPPNTLLLKKNKVKILHVYGSAYPVFEKMTIENTSSLKIKDVWIVVNDKDWSDTGSLTLAIQQFHPNPDTVHKRIMTMWAFVRQNMYAFTPPIANWTIHDAVFNLNVFGYGLCDDFAHIMEGLAVDYLKILPQSDARVWALSGHVVPEFYYDEEWHSPDANVSYYSSRDKEVLGVQELATEYNHIIREVIGGIHGKNVSDIYASIFNNSIIQKWRDPPEKMRWTIWPGEKIEYYRQNFGEFYSVLDSSTPPHEFSNGIIIQRPILYFPSGCWEYVNVKKVDNSFRLVNPEENGYLIIPVESPYILVDSNLTMQADFLTTCSDCQVYFSRDLSEWQLLRHDIDKQDYKVSIGKELRFAKSYDFYRRFFVKIVLNKPLGIKELEIRSLFQVCTKSLPEIKRGANRILLKSESDIPLKVTIEYKKEHLDLKPPLKPIYSTQEKIIRWQPPSSMNHPIGYQITISSDEFCLWPVQPHRADVRLPHTQDSFNLEGLEAYLKDAGHYFFKVSAIYKGDYQEYWIPADIQSFVYFSSPQRN